MLNDSPFRLYRDLHSITTGFLPGLQGPSRSDIKRFFSRQIPLLSAMSLHDSPCMAMLSENRMKLPLSQCDYRVLGLRRRGLPG